ncbi:hypothetical protein LTR78_009596 [Recurvomyces mirabilis]|uniref:Uncharacterized protein n=1 Tax=Recurvomyces mirabilis TaxID=574656 RepID=A0AAE0WHB2_9PEZI|nr:hypothetical protein LTR78_009596 [Recurvomyces mirabilis]KAK5156595.1 hypothetical protein LTS14_004807 [Recurvomyces mirabilis]
MSSNSASATNAASSSASASQQSSSAAASSSLASAISSSVASQVSSAVQQGSTTTVEPSSTNIITSIVSASAADPTTQVITSVVTQSAVSNGVTNTNPVTVVVTSVNTNRASTTYIPVAGSSTAASASATSSSPAQLSNNGSNGSNSGNSGGLSTAALLVALGIWFWRKRKQSKDNQEQRRKEIDEYGYNPNNDPTLPAVAGSEAGGPQMAEDHSGYRGWGAAAASTNRKTSTTLSGGHTQGQLSDNGNSYNAHSPGSPGAAYSDGHSGDPLVHQRDTMNSDELGALGAAPLAVVNPGIRRGPSNASSAYSAGARSEGSDEPVPPLPVGQAYENNPNANYGYGQHGPYGDGSYGGGQDSAGMPIVRDVSARRNTRIQQGGTYQQGNSGIAQNF